LGSSFFGGAGAGLVTATGALAGITSPVGARSVDATTKNEAKPVAVTASCFVEIWRSAKFSAEKKDGTSFCTEVFGVGPWKKK
jgi:hypothetical protein